VEGFLKGNKYQEAETTINRVVSYWGRSKAWVIFALEYIRIGKVKDAASIIERVRSDWILKKGFSVPWQERESLYEFLNVLAKTSQLGKSLMDEIVNWLKQDLDTFCGQEARERAFEMWTMALVKAGQYGLARQTLLVKKSKRSHDIWLSLIEALTINNRIQEALETVLEIPSDFQQEAQQLIGIAIAKSGHFEKAKEIAKDLPSWLQEQFLLILMVEQYQTGILTEANKTFECLTQTVLAKEYDSSRTDSFMKMAIALGQVAFFEKAMSISRNLSIERFMVVILSWQKGFELITSSSIEAANLLYSLIIRVLRIAGWTRNDCQEIYKLITEENSFGNT
jgi:hypothetical protein